MEVECLLFLSEDSIFFWLEYLLFGDLSSHITQTRHCLMSISSMLQRNRFML